MLSGLALVLGAFYFPGRENSAAPKVTQNTTGSITFSTSFAQEPVGVDKKLLDEKNTSSKKAPPTRIIIPSLNIDIPVKEAKVVDGYWEVFDDRAGFGLGSAYPEDDKGNQVIFAHARQGLFLPLKEIKLGQSITVLTEDRWYSYTVEELKEVTPDQLEVIAPTKDPVLTLYTCSGYADSKRFIVRASRNPL